MKFNKTNNGFSLVEMIVVIAILGISLPLMNRLLGSVNQYSRAAELSAKLQEEANLSMKKVQMDLNSAVALFDSGSFSSVDGCSFLPQGCYNWSNPNSDSTYNTYDSANKYKAVADNLFAPAVDSGAVNSSTSLWPVKDADKPQSVYTIDNIPSAIAMMSYKNDDTKTITGKSVNLYKFIVYYMGLSDELYYDKKFSNAKKYYRKLIRAESIKKYYIGSDYSASEKTVLNNKGYIEWNYPATISQSPTLPTNLSNLPKINNYTISVLARSVAPNSVYPTYPLTNTQLETINNEIVPVTGGVMFFRNKNTINVRMVLAKGLNNVPNIYTIALNNLVVANNIN